MIFEEHKRETIFAALAEDKHFPCAGCRSKDNMNCDNTTQCDAWTRWFKNAWREIRIAAGKEASKK